MENVRYFVQGFSASDSLARKLFHPLFTINRRSWKYPGTMTPSSSINPWKFIILVFILLAVVFFTYVAWQFDQSTRQSERHKYSYTIEFSHNTTIDNVTFILPIAELNNTPFFTESLLNGTAYGLSPDWALSLVNENGSPMLAIKSARMVPDYHGSPIAIEPDATSPLPTTLVPGHEYTSDTPILMPITISVMEMSISGIDTRTARGHEPVFFPGGNFIQGSSVTPLSGGSAYDHRVPVYINYTSERPAGIWLRVSVTGTNMIWRGGWQSNIYSDSVFVEINDGTKGWIEGEGKLITAEGVYY